MAPILNIPSDTFLIALEFAGDGLPRGATTTFALRDLTPPAPDVVAQAVADRLVEHFTVNVWSDDAAITVVHVKQGPVETGPTFDLGVDIGGDQASQASFPQGAFLIRKNVVGGGRRNRGRMFWPAVPENVVDSGGQIATGTASNFTDALNTFFSDLQSTHGLFHVLLHRHDPDQGQAPVAPSDVSSVTVQTLVATQRRRVRR